MLSFLHLTQTSLTCNHCSFTVSSSFFWTFLFCCFATTTLIAVITSTYCFTTALLQLLQHNLASPLLLLQLLHPFVALHCSFLAVIAFLYPSFIPLLLPSGFCNLHGIVHSIVLFDSPATVRRHLVIHHLKLPILGQQLWW